MKPLHKQIRDTTLAIAVTYAIGIGAAAAHPPAPGTPDAEEMAPYGDWIKSQYKDGKFCCDAADGRPVDYRTAGDHYEVHLTPEKFEGVTDSWVSVPESAILRDGSPAPFAIVWVWQGMVRCAAFPGGV